MSAVANERLAEVFVELADTLVDDFDVVEFLQTVASRAAELAASHAAGLLLADQRNQLRFMAASDERVHLLEIFQLEQDEGPCRDAFAQGVHLSSGDLREAGGRWPSFAPRAVEAGFHSVQAFPLRLRRNVIGVLGLFGADPSAMTPADVKVVQALADVAAIGLIQEEMIRRAEVLSSQLQGALNSRIVIEQAKGAIAQLYGTTVDEAFVMLRSYCRRTHQRLGDVARLVVTDPDSAPDLHAPHPDGPRPIL